MSKWADYGISAVRYNEAHTHIDRVQLHADTGDTLGWYVESTRAEIIGAIKQGKTYITIVEDSHGQWQQGEPVRIINVHGIEYIQTVDNGKPTDSLEHLPEF